MGISDVWRIFVAVKSFQASPLCNSLESVVIKKIPVSFQPLSRMRYHIVVIIIARLFVRQLQIARLHLDALA